VVLDLERLAAALPELSEAELAGLARAWESRRADEPEDLIAWLHSRGALAEATLHRAARSSRAPVLVGASEQLAGPTALRVLGEVGRGAMGEVLLARDERLHRTVALKRLDPRLAHDPGMVRRFVVEAQLTAQLDHPGIVPVHAVETPEGEPPSYAMKLVRGRTLKAWITEARERAEKGEAQPERMALPARLDLFCQICEPLAYAHARGVLHRDLKPDNVMVGPFGEVFVMDWGVARLIGGESQGLSGPTTGEGTQAGDIVGTPSYLSPEQARGENDKLDARSDQFTLGLLLFEIATLRRARASIKGGPPMILAATRAHLDPIVGLAEPIPRELVAVIRKATNPDRERRYPDVSALAEEVRRVLRGEAVVAQPDGGFQKLGRTLARNRERVAIALVGLAALGVAGFGLSVAGVMGLREADRSAAETRAARRVELAALVDTRARALDRALLRDEGLLRGLASAALRALSSPRDAPVYLAAAYADPTTAPPDLTPSPVYGAKTSFLQPDLAAAPDFDVTAGHARLAALASLRDELVGVLLGSSDPPPRDVSEARARVLLTGTPVVWAYVATTDGVLVGYPGVGSYPPGYDPRERPWYAEGLGHAAPAWGAPYVDESGMGLLIGCTMALVDGAGAKVGVAGLDVPVRELVKTWLAPGDLPAEGFLLGADGKVVVRSSGSAAEPDFPFTAVWTEVKADPAAGQASVEGEFAAWSRLEAVPWTYVVVGKEAGLVR